MNPIEKLEDTIELMTSDLYKDRFKGEYNQAVIRFEKLKKMLDTWDNDKESLGFAPPCPRTVYNLQIKAMADYIASLEIRASIENIEL